MYYVKLSKSTPNPSNTNQPFSNSRVTIINKQDLDQFGLLGSHQFCAFACSIITTVTGSKRIDSSCGSLALFWVRPIYRI